MPRSAAPLTGLALAALLALSACSSSTEDEPAGDTTAEATASASATAASTAEASVGAGVETTATPGAGAGSYSSEELTTILGMVELPDGSALQVLPTEQLDQSMELAREFLDSVEIMPEECGVFVSNTLETPEGAGYATGVAMSDGDAVQTVVSLASSTDTAFAEDRIEASDDALDACSTFSVETQGLTVDQEVERLEATTDADRTFGTLTHQSSADAGEQETMTVVGLRGDLAVTALRTAQGSVPEGSQEELQELIDATLEAAR
ncbi:hypothetical protein FQ377_02850 [Arthrobacter echini]|uniref:Sensor domain-containing protein n=1 Tax=Arthrobacter echini TaxID=1529066 RepID=A0A5D0XUJ5_9MICC|nr:hypothetical protein [Arthrobacter echini]TYD00404.1 hypothetical protein FQ377_02850 [Arthrobacter echini]